MSAIDDLIAEKSRNNPEFARLIREEERRLDAAVALHDLREMEGLSQRQLAEKSGRPQSTIARIENGTMNVSLNVLADIAESVGKKLKFEFVDA